MRKITIISNDAYHEDMEKLLSIIDYDFDCIVALKRSGFILGAFLSNKLDKPLFIPSEIDSIPDIFKNVLVVDDKICTGKSMKKVLNKLIREHKTVKTATLYIQRDKITDYYVKNTGSIVKMWYEA